MGREDDTKVCAFAYGRLDFRQQRVAHLHFCFIEPYFDPVGLEALRQSAGKRLVDVIMAKENAQHGRHLSSLALGRTIAMSRRATDASKTKPGLFPVGLDGSVIYFYFPFLFFLRVGKRHFLKCLYPHISQQASNMLIYVF